MNQPTMLICSTAFNDEERARLEAAVPSHFVAEPTDIAALPEDLRAGIKVLAFKWHAPLGAPAMDPLPDLGLIANFGVGYDSIDVDAASTRGIKVTNTPDVLNDDVADLAVALMLGVARNLEAGAAYVRQGRWAAEGNMGLARKMSCGKVGIVGLGRIGREIADRLAAFKMEIHYSSRSEKDTPGWTYHADPVSLAAAVDWLVVALVGGPETRHHVSAEVIAAMGADGILVNISRGSTIDEAALLDALEQGTIAGAGLDVFANEPDVDPRFLSLPNVLLQPHVASATVATRRAMAELQLENIRAYLSGKPLITPVN